ncbi:unnamed protein product [Rotaria sp. Silwood2]|nr:unnamed protein product [Rotaria sp. Silwood2]
MIFVLIGFVNIIPDNKDVLISGCDTVVGHILAIELDKQGFNVFAGVHIPDNKTILKAKLSTRAKIFHLDITKEEDIDTVFELVQKKTNTLHGLINNARIITHGYIDWTPIELMRKIMNVNFFGHVATTKKVLTVADKKTSVSCTWNLRTPMNEGYADIVQNLWNELSNDIQERWGNGFLNSLITRGISSPIMKHPDDPKTVVRAV